MERTALRRSLVALGITYSVLWACAPAFMPPPTPMADGRDMEVGLAPAVGYAPESPYGFEGPVELDGHAYFRAHTAPKLDVGVGVFGGTSSLIGASLWLDWRVLDTDRVILGPGVAFGFLYAEVSVPFAVRVAPHGWLYTRPRVGVGRSQVPLGIAFSLPQGVGITVEAGASLINTIDGTLVGPFPTAAVAVSWQLRP